MQRRELLKYLAGVGTVAGLSPLSAFTGRTNPELTATPSRAGSSLIAPVTSAKNLVIVVNMLGYNQHTFNPPADDLNSSPLLAQLKDHHGDLTVFKGIMQPEIIRGHNGGRGILTCNKNQTNGPYISLDQLASEHLQQATRHKSVHMGHKTIVWNKNSRAVPTLHELGPQKIFDHLFGETPTGEIERKLKSIRTMRQSLPKGNRAAYVASFEEHEQSLATDLELSLIHI